MERDNRIFLGVVIGIVVVSVGGYFAWPSIPGTLTAKDDGTVWGTGTITRYFHKTARPAWREEYSRGVLKRTTWFTRSGEIIQQTDWRDGTGIAVGLRGDGSIKIRGKYTDGRPVKDTLEFFDPAGKKVTEDEFKAGEADNWGKGGPPAEERDYFPTEPE